MQVVAFQDGRKTLLRVEVQSRRTPDPLPLARLFLEKKNKLLKQFVVLHLTFSMLALNGISTRNVIYA